MPQSIDSEEHRHSHLSTVEARQGIMLGRMRYVLGISLSLAIVSLLIVMIFFYGP